MKLSSECGAEIRFQVGRSKARQFYINTLGWFAATFDSIDWEARDKALDSKPDMFKIWLCKQGSGFCATGTNMQRWFGDEITHCPNCGAANENAAHLLHCPDTGRFSLYRQEVTSLQGWLNQDHTHPELARVLPQYILGRGAVKFASLPIHSVDILRLAHQQDLIGWLEAWQHVDAHVIAPMLARLAAGEPQRLVLCGEHEFHVYDSAAPTLWQRVRTHFAPTSLDTVLAVAPLKD